MPVCHHPSLSLRSAPGAEIWLSPTVLLFHAYVNALRVFIDRIVYSKPFDR
jgi:hypothetical protein